MAFAVKKIKKKKSSVRILVKGISNFWKSKKISKPSKDLDNSIHLEIKPFYRKKQNKAWRKTSIVIGVILISIGIWFVYNVTTSVYNFLRNFEMKNLVFMWGSDLKTDQNANTNILIIGEGGLEHESPDLTDSIMVASIRQSDQSVTLFSIPRDLYIDDNMSRINQVYERAKSRYKVRLHKAESEAEELAMRNLASVIEDITDQEINYIIRVDFNAFKELVDALGGITVNVENDINDPYYPDDNSYGFKPFNITKGTHTLNGETALKYVRSRKTSSDYDRSRRQRKVILALKDAALKKSVLSSPSKIKALYNAVKNNIYTDLTISEIITVAEFASKFTDEKLISFGLNDDPLQTGGFLYTPPRDEYEGAFVLKAFRESWIKTFCKLIFESRDLFITKPEIIVLNGTEKRGLATSIYFYLQRFGLNVVDVDNTLNKELFKKTTIYYPSAHKELIKQLVSLNKKKYTLIPCIEDKNSFDNNIYCDKYKNQTVFIAGQNFDGNIINPLVKDE